LKLAFGLTQLEAGGAQTRVFATAEVLRRRGHSVDLYLLYRKRDVFEDSPKFILSDRGGASGLIRAGFALRRELRKGDYDAFIANGVVVSLIGSISALTAGIRNRVSVQTLAPQNRRKIYNILDMLWGTVGLFRRNIANSHWTSKQYSKYPRAYRKRMRIVPNGIPPLAGLEPREAARAKLGITEGEFRFITVGRLAEQKNQGVLISALVEVPEATLAIVGDGESRESLVALATSLGVSDRVHFLGELGRESLTLQLCAADVFLFASRWESFGLASAEAASAGLPLIVSDLDIHHEILGVVDSDSDPVFVDSADVDGWSRAMRDALLRSEAGRADARRVGLEIAAAHSLEKHVERLLAVVED
jgi:glycosyltransferase involved in cell wall biosynthesis